MIGCHSEGSSPKRRRPREFHTSMPHRATYYEKRPGRPHENRLKPSIKELPKLELKELPEHLEYAFLQGKHQLPVVISSSLSGEEKSKLLNVLRNHKGVIACNIADIKGIDSSFCTHNILIEDEYKPTVQPQRRVNPNIMDVVKKEVIKLLGTGLIYPVFDSP
ncbi:hypothetical protein Tco_0265532 [Tanacetum coccineum]